MSNNNIFLLCLMILLNFSRSRAAINGTNGYIKFDSNSHGSSEMILLDGKLGIGVTLPTANLHVNGNAIISNSLIVGGTTNPSSSNLHIHGTMAHDVSNLSPGLTTLGSGSFFIADTSAGDISIFLPSAVNHLGRMITVNRTSLLNNLYVSGGGSLVDNYANMLFLSGNLTSLQFFSNGTQWYITGAKNPETEESKRIWWKLDDSSGTTATDSSTWNYHGGLSSSLNFSGNSLAGPMGNSLRLVNIDDGISNSGNAVQSAGYTYSMWVRSTVASTTAVTLPVLINAKAGFCWGHQDSNYQHAAYHEQADGSKVLAQLASGLAANVWHYISVSWDGSTLQSYLDGVASGSNTATSWAGGESVFADHPGSFISGNILYDDIRYYERPLSATLIQSFYLEGSP
jgi:hypothetical protein